MDYIIREMRSEEYCLLSDFLYEAIYIPEGIEPPPKSVIECPELQEYIVEFGNRKHDKALVAEIQGNVVGAIWVRIMNDYGHIDNDTPSLAMSVCPQYRGLGIGTSLLKQLLQVERLAGYSLNTGKAEKELQEFLKNNRINLKLRLITDEKSFFRRLDSLKPASEYEDDGTVEYAARLLKNLSM